MRMILDEVRSLKERLNDIGTALIKNDINALSELIKESQNITKVFTAFVGDAPELNSMGLDLPIDIISEQLSRYIEGIKNRDMMLLTDNVNFELLDTLKVYEEILVQLS